jgi:hypothetical protein
LLIRSGSLKALAIKTKINVAKKYLIVKKTNGSAYGSMYFAPIKPVLQSKTNIIGAKVFTLAITR